MQPQAVLVEKEVQVDISSSELPMYGGGSGIVKVFFFYLFLKKVCNI